MEAQKTLIDSLERFDEEPEPSIAASYKNLKDDYDVYVATYTIFKTFETKKSNKSAIRTDTLNALKPLSIRGLIPRMDKRILARIELAKKFQ
jgi:hypothetical protein